MTRVTRMCVASDNTRDFVHSLSTAKAGLRTLLEIVTTYCNALSTVHVKVILPQV